METTTKRVFKVPERTKIFTLRYRKSRIEGSRKNKNTFVRPFFDAEFNFDTFSAVYDIFSMILPIFRFFASFLTVFSVKSVRPGTFVMARATRWVLKVPERIQKLRSGTEKLRIEILLKCKNTFARLICDAEFKLGTFR